MNEQFSNRERENLFIRLYVYTLHSLLSQDVYDCGRKEKMLSKITQLHSTSLFRTPSLLHINLKSLSKFPCWLKYKENSQRAFCMSSHSYERKISCFRWKKIHKFMLGRNPSGLENWRRVGVRRRAHYVQIIIIHYSECDKLFRVLNSLRIMMYVRAREFALISLKTQNIFYDADARRRPFRSRELFVLHRLLFY